MLIIRLQQQRPGEPGFTLLEVLVALVVTSIFLTLLLPISVSSVRRAEFSAIKNRAWFLAKSQLEDSSACKNTAIGLTKGREASLSWERAVDNGGGIRDTSVASGISLRTVRVRVSEGDDPSPLADISIQRLCIAQ